MNYKNPIIPGCNPDPSICCVGDDFYLVVSSFEFFPGIPIYHSTNLIDWELIGHCLDTDEKLNLKGCMASGGLYAPTIRYHQGTFFVTCTNVSDKGNFIIHTQDIRAGWSEPVWVDQKGIDPSLFFDDDGKVYFLSAFGEVYISEVDPFTGERKTEVKVFNMGCGGKNPEAPHIYKKDGMYYLLLAEGGTEYGHMGTIQRATDIYGPYEPCPHNPIFTNKDQTEVNIHCIGHGDLVEDNAGAWWMICLGVRTLSDFYLNRLLHNLGREVFLAPVIWKSDGWPYVANDGVIGYEMEGQLPGQCEGTVCHDFFDDFSEMKFSPYYHFIRNPRRSCYERDSVHKKLILRGDAITLNQTDSPVFVGVRQKEFLVEAMVMVSQEEIKKDSRVGLTAYYNENYHYEIYLGSEDGEYTINLSKHIHDIQQITMTKKLPTGKNVWLKIQADTKYYRFLYSINGECFEELGTGVTAGLCTETTMDMTYTGVYLGMFAENGTGYFEKFSVMNTEKV